MTLIFDKHYNSIDKFASILIDGIKHKVVDTEDKLYLEDGTEIKIEDLHIFHNIEVVKNYNMEEGGLF